MTIGIVTTCHTYYSFIPGWLESIRNLSTQPDQIVIAATDPEECRRNIADADDKEYPIESIRLRAVPRPHPGIFPVCRREQSSPDPVAD